MARSAETVLRDTIGNLIMDIARLQAALDECQEKCAKLEADKESEKKEVA